MKLILIAFALLIYNVPLCQISEKVSNQMGLFPLLFIDSVESGMRDLEKIDPMDISNILILVPKTAKKTLGKRGSDGAIYVTTIPFAKLNYWKFLSAKSQDYLEKVPKPDSDTNIVYILNDTVLTQNPAGSLYLINKRNFRSLSIIPQPILENRYGIINKQFGVLIKAKKKKKRNK